MVLSLTSFTFCRQIIEIVEQAVPLEPNRLNCVISRYCGFKKIASSRVGSKAFFQEQKLGKERKKRGFTQESEGERRRDKVGQERNEEEKNEQGREKRKGRGGNAERVKRVSDDRVAAKSALWGIAKSVK